MNKGGSKKWMAHFLGSISLLSASPHPISPQIYPISALPFPLLWEFWTKTSQVLSTSILLEDIFTWAGITQTGKKRMEGNLVFIQFFLQVTCVCTELPICFIFYFWKYSHCDFFFFFFFLQNPMNKSFDFLNPLFLYYIFIILLYFTNISSQSQQ